MLKKILFGLAFSVTLLLATAFWLYSLLDKHDYQSPLKNSLPVHLPYLQQPVPTGRGKILAVVSSTGQADSFPGKLGYELTELSRAYFVFVANGYTVDIASPEGGAAPMIVDQEDLNEYDYAFLNDASTMAKVQHTQPIASINASDYEAVYFVGGKGAMFDFPTNPAIKTLVRDLYQNNKVIAAVCHGPAALVDITLSNGQPLLSGKQVSAFTNEEELFLIPEAKTVFPFLLQNKIEQNGAHFAHGQQYLRQVSHDGHLITGQNPWSVWALAEKVITQLGHQPVPRLRTRDEYSIDIMLTLDNNGMAAALQHLQHIVTIDNQRINRNLIAMHAIVAIAKGELLRFVQLVRLVHAGQA